MDGGDTLPVELGVKFVSEVPGFVSGVRFYKSAGNTGTHVGNLWSSTGTRLATVTFTGETASGWQQVNFSTPVAVAANTTYVVSYFAPNGHYSGNFDYFVTQRRQRRRCTRWPMRASGGNGVFAYGADERRSPTSTYRALNYWVDVVFSAQATAQLTSIAVTPANPAVARRRDAAVHGHRHVLRPEHAGPDEPGDVDVLEPGGCDDQCARTRATAASQGTTTITGALGELNGTTTLTVQPAGRRHDHHDGSSRSASRAPPTARRWPRSAGRRRTSGRSRAARCRPG